MKNFEMLKYFPNHLKTKKKMSKYAVKKLRYLLRYVPDQYKNQLVCNNVILENGVTLKSVSDCYKNKKMCNQTIDNYPHALEFVSECYKTQKFMMKLSILSILKFVPECLMTREVCHKPINRCFLYLILFLINTKLENV